MKLIPINEDGGSEVDHWLSDLGRQIVQVTRENYLKNGFQKPWCGYFAIVGEGIIGTCAFKKPIHKGAVEIAYFTFPEFEGKGYATQMAEALIKLAKEFEPTVCIKAQTLAQENASTRILTKLGFKKIGSVNHPEDGLVWEWALEGGRN